MLHQLVAEVVEEFVIVMMFFIRFVSLCFIYLFLHHFLLPLKENDCCPDYFNETDAFTFCMFLKRFFSFKYCNCHKVLVYPLKLLTSQNKIIWCYLFNNLAPKAQNSWQEMWSGWQVVVVMRMKRSNGLRKYFRKYFEYPYNLHGTRKIIDKLASHSLHLIFPSCKVFQQGCVFSHNKNSSHFLGKKKLNYFTKFLLFLLVCKKTIHEVNEYTF